MTWFERPEAYDRCYIPEILIMRTDIYWQDRTAEYMRNSGSGLIFDWKKRGERLLLWTKMYMYERLENIRLLIFFQPKIKTYPKLRMTAEIRLQYRIKQSPDMLYVYVYVKCYISEVLKLRTCHWLSRWWYCRQRRPVTARNR